eukprot:SAG11_NODE_5668_length_1490_cov_4.624730_2_plen_104_part_00
MRMRAADEAAELDVFHLDATAANNAEAVKLYGVQQYPTIKLLKGQSMQNYNIETPEHLTSDALPIACDTVAGGLDELHGGGDTISDFKRSSAQVEQRISSLLH